jgi:hypothetical protein
MCGDIIQIPAGTTITALSSTGLTIPTKTCDAQHYITVETSAVLNLPSEGTRLTPCYAGVTSLPGRPAYPCPAPSNYMGKIVAAPTAGSATRAITLSANSSYIRFIGLEITRSAGSGINTALVVMNAGGVNHIIFDRVWAHGNATDETTRFANLSGTSFIAAVDGTYTDFFCISVSGACTDAQAFLGGLGSSTDATFKIVNNFMEGAAETIELGGGMATTTPRDWEIRLNHMFKPLTWNPGHPSYNGGIGSHPFIVKNLCEAKNADRVLLEGNIFENTWGGFSQLGPAVLLTPKNQAGNLCPLCQVTNITIRYNLIHTASEAFQIANAPADDGNFPMAGNSYSVHDNIADNLNYATCYKCQSSASTVPLSTHFNAPASLVMHDVSVNHNTFIYANPVFGTPLALLAVEGPLASTGREMSNIIFTNNLGENGTRGVTSNGTGSSSDCAQGFANGAAASIIDNCWNPNTFGGNALVNNNNSVSWPGSNCFAPSYASMLVNYNNGAGGDYHLAANGSCHLAATDGTDPGANIDLVNSMTEGVQ